jgi:deazaflavin-dependent oxidoreductase (nitroreductase family)
MAVDYRETNRQVIVGFRAGEPLPGMHRERLLLLTTTGRRSGDRHTTPMMFHREDGRTFVIASNVGAASDPEWCLNLRAHPAVTVEVGDEPGSPAYAATASVLEGDDRAAVWSRIVALYPFFADHQEQAVPREIPVVELTRVG